MSGISTFADNEFSDSEDEGEGGRRDNRSYKRNKRPRLEAGTAGSDAEAKEEKDPKRKYNHNTFYNVEDDCGDRGHLLIVYSR